MSTISVPLSAELMQQLEHLTKNTGASRASIMRKALEELAENAAVDAILQTEKEPVLRGDLDELVSKMK